MTSSCGRGLQMADNRGEGQETPVLVACVSLDDASNGEDKGHEMESSFVDIDFGEDSPDAAGRVQSDTVASFDILQSVSVRGRWVGGPPASSWQLHILSSPVHAGPDRRRHCRLRQVRLASLPAHAPSGERRGGVSGATLVDVCESSQYVRVEGNGAFGVGHSSLHEWTWSTSLPHVVMTKCHLTSNA